MPKFVVDIPSHRSALLVTIALLLASCASSTAMAPVRTVTEKSKTHIVKKGDTIYSIAWRHGKDYKSLADANRIASPYTIYIGQRISIRGQKYRSSYARPSAKKTVKIKESAGRLKWDWPMTGKILNGFSLRGKVNKGIDIASQSGTGVKAAADGIVVYAGGNLRGYGKLVIVKHDKRFLSAYGNNRSIRVDEGDSVKSGQKLAEVGSNGSNIAMLHFEIRRDGIPVNPVNYLPAL